MGDTNKNQYIGTGRTEEWINPNTKIPILYEKKENCCGCFACYSVCSVHAITMKADREGFLYPIIDAEKCIQCYRCLSVCAFKVDQRGRGFI